MSNITTEVKITRLQNLRAMERMMVTMGGKDGTIAWLNAMPADAAFANAGSVSNQTLQQIAEDNESYEKAVMAFARHMAPILHDMALGGVNHDGPIVGGSDPGAGRGGGGASKG